MKKTKGFAVLLAVLLALSLLPSCAAPVTASPPVSDAGAGADTPASVSASAGTVLVASAVPADVLTPDDIAAYLKQTYFAAEVTISQTTDIGADFRLVDYNLKTASNGFALYHLKTSVIELLPVQDVTLKKVVNENYFIFEDRGEYTDSAFRFFPSIVRCFRSSTDQGNENFTTIHEAEFYDLERSVQGGSKDNELLASVTVTLDGLQVIFKPSGINDAMFYAAATDIPVTKTSYDPDAHQFTVEIATAKLDGSIKTGVDIQTDDNLYMSSYKILLKDGKTTIDATLRDAADCYAIEVKKGPTGKDFSGDLPYMTLTFDKKSDSPSAY